MNISRNITIEAPIEKVRSAINDFHTWPAWSPWLIAEPNAELNIDPDGKYYSWSGKIVGAGEMRITEERENGSKMDLTFLKPWKSKAKVEFDLAEEGSATRVTWSMESSLPFFLFWMKKKMEAFIGSDYERGLNMLKEYIETGKVQSEITYEGIQSYPGLSYIGITRTLSMEEMKNTMGGDFEKLMKQLSGGNGQWFTIYHKFDMVKDVVKYTACVGVDESAEALDADVEKGVLDPCAMYVVRHRGPYDHIGNAWSAAMMSMRAKKLKAKRKTAPIEFYRNSPQNTAPADLVSDICFIVNNSA